MCFLKESDFNETTQPLPDAFNSKSERIDRIWSDCVKTDSFRWFSLNLVFSGHSCFYQTDRIGLVAAGGKLVTVKVVLTKESQAPPKMLMSVEIFSQNDDGNGNFLPNCWCQWKISGIFYRFYPLHEIELGWEMFLMPELLHFFYMLEYEKALGGGADLLNTTITGLFLYNLA